MKKNVGFVFTNYNNSEYTKNCIKSIMECSDNHRCIITIVDNNSEEDDIKLLKELEIKYPNVEFIYNNKNIGYFKGLNVGIEYLRSKYNDLNLLIIGNNDLVFPNNFLDLLDNNLELLETYPVLSPDLLTLDGVHQNPHVIDSISPLREFIWDVYYSNYYISVIMKKMANFLRNTHERKDYTNYKEPGLIYQGYGACYILGPVFFDNFDALDAPTFLMGEELFLTKQLESKGYNVYYEPSILVYHHDHASTDKVPSKMMWNICKESHVVYRNRVGYFSSKRKY